MKWVLRITGAFLLFVLAFFLFGYITMELWNWLIPDIFSSLHLKPITYGQAIGLVILSKLLFGGFRMKSHGYWGGPFGQRRFWKAKWESMTDEERDRFKTEFAERCRHRWGRVEVKVERTEGA